jgi:hypothetical protein
MSRLEEIIAGIDHNEITAEEHEQITLRAAAEGPVDLDDEDTVRKLEDPKLVAHLAKAREVYKKDVDGIKYDRCAVDSKLRACNIMLTECSSGLRSLKRAMANLSGDFRVIKKNVDEAVADNINRTMVSAVGKQMARLVVYSEAFDEIVKNIEDSASKIDTSRSEYDSVVGAMNIISDRYEALFSDAKPCADTECDTVDA